MQDSDGFVTVSKRRRGGAEKRSRCVNELKTEGRPKGYRPSSTIAFGSRNT